MIAEVACGQCGAPTEPSAPCRYCGAKLRLSPAKGVAPLCIEVEDWETSAALDVGYLFQVIAISGKKVMLSKFGDWK